MSQDLAGKIAVVTGSSRGIGRGTAIALGEAGATVYITGRSSGEGALTIDRDGFPRRCRRGTRNPDQSRPRRRPADRRTLFIIEASGGKVPPGLQSPLFVGRSIAALAGSGKAMERIGSVVWVEDLAEEFGFVDEQGAQPPGYSRCVKKD